MGGGGPLGLSIINPPKFQNSPFKVYLYLPPPPPNKNKMDMWKRHISVIYCTITQRKIFYNNFWNEEIVHLKFQKYYMYKNQWVWQKTIA